ncbi:MAG: hypothetical protein M9894_08450 [Planctomycetes bacterium]|nr:hypothetical protein [Planctomycetota bacterium]
MNPESRHAGFPRTSASLVAEAANPGSPGWRAAWERFFREYWPPLYAYLRRTGSASQEALDVLQDFFVAGLDGRLLGAWDAGRGRLRTYLLSCLANHRRKAWRRERARPDGERPGWLEGHGAAEVLAEAALGRGAGEPAAADPEASFERDWAQCLWGRAVAALEERLRQEGDEAGQRLLGEWVLAPVRPGADEVAAALGLTRNALYVRATRLRQALADEVERRLRWLEARPEALAQERDAVLRLSREAGR